MTDRPLLPTLPVTTISGFHGSGKTTLLEHLLNNTQGMRVAALVNDMSALKIDRMLLNTERSGRGAAAAEWIEMNNGCICCTLRDEFVSVVSRLAEEKRFDYLLVEATGVSEPLPLAMAFDAQVAEHQALYDLAQLDTMVTVVDAFSFMKDFTAAAELRSLHLALDEGDSRTVADLLAEQVEFANVIVVNKTDLIEEAELERLLSILRRMNPGAQLIPTMRGVVPLESVLLSGAFEAASCAAARRSRGTEGPERDRQGVSSFVYRARRPFHPERLFEVLHSEWPGVLRTKGIFWLASRMSDSGFWSQAGPTSFHAGGGVWWATVPPEQWPDEETLQRAIQEEFKGPYGDRRQELVVIGVDVDEAAIRAALDKCLLDDSELKMGPMGWLCLNDPFPNWGEDNPEEPNFAPVLRRDMPLA
jgi:G3E family GTPase